MSVARRDPQAEVLKIVAHQIRGGIMLSLTQGQRTFTDLMLDCGLDPGSETGLFLYHLSKLMEQDFVIKRHGKYESTERGDEASRLLRSLTPPHIYSHAEEGGEKMTRKGVDVHMIGVEEVKVGDMVIGEWEFRPGEVRVYEESGRIPSYDFDGGSFFIEECLGSVNLPSESGKAFMIRHETYTRKYVGTERNKIRTPFKDGYYLSMREYDTISCRDDGIFYLWTSVWGPNNEDEKPDETLYDRPRKWNEPPMKIGDEASDEREEGDYVYKAHSKVMGQCVVRIDDRSYDCLLKRTHAVWSKDGENEIDRVGERFVTDKLVDILTRTYHAPTQKRRWMLESLKGWEDNPTVECCGEKHYMTGEFYLVKRSL